MEFKIRHSSTADIPVILRLRDAARLIMRQSGNMTQWPVGEPRDSLFEADVAARVSHIVEADGRPVATFALLPGPDPAYAVVSSGLGWQRPDGEYFVIHRLASDGSAPGVFSAVMDFCSAVRDLRVDTHKDNVIMRHLLAKYGFAYVGVICLANGSQRMAFQRLTKA